MGNDNLEIRSEAARLAVYGLCLASATDPGWPPKRVLLLPQLDLVDYETAAEILERLSKPIACLGVHYLECLAIGVWQVDSGAEVGKKGLNSTGSTVPDPKEPVAVHGSGSIRDRPILTVSFGAYEYWTRTYRIIGVNYSLVDLQEGETQERFSLRFSKWDREGFALGLVRGALDS